MCDFYLTNEKNHLLKHPRSARTDDLCSSFNAAGFSHSPVCDGSSLLIVIKYFFL